MTSDCEEQTLPKHDTEFRTGAFLFSGKAYLFLQVYVMHNEFGDRLPPKPRRGLLLTGDFWLWVVFSSGLNESPCLSRAPTLANLANQPAI
jgi:hypothetical protein